MRPRTCSSFNARIDNTAITTLEGIVNSEFLRLSYTEAIEILEKSGQTFEYPVSWGSDLQAEHERYLTEQKFKLPGDPVRLPAHASSRFTCASTTTAARCGRWTCWCRKVGEIIGGSQREERLDVLEARMREQKLEPENYWWYLDLRRYGTVPHSGFGLGLERVVQFITGMGNIRDVIPFPRTPGSADF